MSYRLVHCFSSWFPYALLVGVVVGVIPQAISAFVILDTSAKSPIPSSADSVIVEAAPGILIVPSQDVLPKTPGTAALPHFRNVLFLSSDNKMVYSYIGVLKALEEYGLEVDLVVTESKAALVGAAWALGYSSAKTEKLMREKPLEEYLTPFPDQEKKAGSYYVPFGLAPRQWSIPLSPQILRASANDWDKASAEENGEFLHLFWLIAKLTHDAPAGPVEELQATPRPLAMQVADLDREQALEIATTGNLQNLLKGALLPVNVLHQRKRLWPFASGAIRSGHQLMSKKLPFTFDKVILIQPSARLHPADLDGQPVSWIDSLKLSRQSEPSEIDGKAQLEGKVVRIEIEPGKDFNPRESDPQKWIELGYLSTLRTMDVLLSYLSPKPVSGRAPGAMVPPAFHTSLELNRVSLNPLASGGRQLLLDLIRTSEKGENDSIGDGAIAEILKSGFYSDLDLEWTRAVGEERASLVFDARDQSVFRFRAGWNIALTQAKISDRSPEVFAGLSWDEPFYIPFRSELGLLLGGHRPGYQMKTMITPLYPLRLDLGIALIHWEMLYPPPPSKGTPMEPLWFSLRRDLAELFLKIYPSRNSFLRTSIQKHVMFEPGFDELGEGEFLSTDFEETGYLGFGQAKTGQISPHSLRLRYRNLNRVNLFGPIKYSTSNFEARVRFSLGDFSISDQYYWSNQEIDGATFFDMLESGRIDAFTFQDEYFLGSLRSPNFQDIKLEYCPVLGKAGLRLVLGGYRQYSPATFFADQLDERIRFHWETQAGYATPLGYLRAGMGGRDNESPFYYLKLGADLSLGFGEMD